MILYTKLKLVMMPRLTSTTKVSIGSGAGNSLMIGARVVMDLATTLQMPIAVALFADGNMLLSL